MALSDRNDSPLSLSHLIDEMMRWFIKWNKVLIETQSAEGVESALPPFLESFNVWYSKADSLFPLNQPAVDRLVSLHQQIETFSRLAIMKVSDHAPLELYDYTSFTDVFYQFYEEARLLEKALAEAASGLDPLTGLRSRIGLFDELRREQSRFFRGGKAFCVAIMDLDHFKKVNDTHGHLVGDRVLASVANHVSRLLRLSDDAYRFGGEEFLLCLKDADLEIGWNVLDRLRESLEEHPIPLSDGTNLHISASFGITQAGKEIKIEDLVQKADQALYEAKQAGRNCVVAK